MHHHPSFSAIPVCSKDPFSGPYCFLSNALPLSTEISVFSVNFHQYAEYTQTHLAVNKENSLNTLMDLAACTKSIYELFGAMSDKSEACMFGISCRVQSLLSSSLDTVEGGSIILSDHIKSPSVTINTLLTFDQRTINRCSTSYFHV